jgi:hypothetical protein
VAELSALYKNKLDDVPCAPENPEYPLVPENPLSPDAPISPE